MTVNGEKYSYLVYCENANKKGYVLKYNYGLFYGSKATKIKILSCGSGIKNMLFTVLTLIVLVLQKRQIVVYLLVVSLQKPKFFCGREINQLQWMFGNCSSLTKLDLSNFITDEVKYMFGMFYNCFKEEQTSILICTASTIKKIIENENSYLTIPNDNEIKNTIANDDNQVKVYKCSVKRVGNNPEITEVEEYQPHQ